jgi:hypothetical protein
VCRANGWTAGRLGGRGLLVMIGASLGILHKPPLILINPTLKVKKKKIFGFGIKKYQNQAFCSDNEQLNCSFCIYIFELFKFKYVF